MVEFSLLVGVGGGELAGLRWRGLFSGLILPRGLLASTVENVDIDLGGVRVGVRSTI